MKKVLFIALIPFLFACNQPAKQAETKAKDVSKLIVPGKSIGTIAINQNADSIIKVLGKPDRSDAAMGSALHTWYAKHDTAAARTSVFAHRDMGNPDEKIPRVKKVIVSSPDFTTAEGLSSGATLSEIGKYYGVRNTGAFLLKDKQIITYSDLDKGIGFEIDSDTRKCIAIMIFPVQDASMAYMNIH